MIDQHPLNHIDNPYSQIKYQTNNTHLLLLWTWIQFIISGFFMFHLFIIISKHSMPLYSLYAIFLFIHIFSYTASLDHKFYAIIVDLLKFILGITLLYYQNYTWFGLNQFLSIILSIYFIFSTVVTIYFYKSNKNIISI